MGRRILFFPHEKMTTQELEKAWLTTREIIKFNVTSEQCCFPFPATAAQLKQHSTKISGKEEKEKNATVFLLSSKAELTAEECLMLKRKYWFIEGTAHQMLDGSRLQEDKSRVRNRNSAMNLAMFRRVAVSCGIHWIRHQKNPRKATLNGFFDEMRRNNSTTPFRMACSKNASWLP